LEAEWIEMTREASLGLFIDKVFVEIQFEVRDIDAAVRDKAVAFASASHNDWAGALVAIGACI
jgi:hypothetical protein